MRRVSRCARLRVSGVATLVVSRGRYLTGQARITPRLIHWDARRRSGSWALLVPPIFSPKPTSAASISSHPGCCARIPAGSRESVWRVRFGRLLLSRVRRCRHRLSRRAPPRRASPPYGSPHHRRSMVCSTMRRGRRPRCRRTCGAPTTRCTGIRFRRPRTCGSATTRAISTSRSSATTLNRRRSRPPLRAATTSSATTGWA
jgi:hypothetical protein